ncbi:MAG: aldo/keto reductase [Myxococcales bacterium]|nr:aldo/keto reductase [Myxococcales bacterium]
MEYRFLGRTGVRVSRLVLGTMAFGGAADEAESRRIFERCRDAGINLFDCADVYNEGRAEELLGRFAAGCRDQVLLTSKAYFPTDRGPNDVGSSRFHLVRAVEASLRRLGTDRIDIFFLHRYDERTSIDESWRALDDLVRQGKILYPAVSNFSAWQTMKALESAAVGRLAPPVCVQPMYNLVKRQAEVEIFPMAESEQLAVLPYSPLGGGLLSGKYGASRKPAKGRLVENKMYQVRYGDPSNFQIAERFSALAAELDVHPAALAIAWVATHPAVTAPILGARSLEQLEPCLGALEIELDDALRERISALAPTPPPATDRNEEASAHNYGSR